METNGSKALTSLSATADGQILIGSSTGGWTKATLTQGANMTITNAAGSITLAATSAASIDPLMGVNLFADPTFRIWAAGDTSDPAHWTTTGTGATIARAGTGLGDTARKVGQFCAKLVSGGGATAYHLQYLLTATSYDDFMDGREVSMGAWVLCSTASNARLTVNDGATTTNSAWHTGSSTWEWLSLTHTVSASATYLNGGLEVASGTKTGYISGATMVLGGDLPTNYIPAPVSPAPWSSRSRERSIPPATTATSVSPAPLSFWTPSSTWSPPLPPTCSQ